MTSVDPVVKPGKSKNRMKGGGNIEFNDKCLDEILHIRNLKMELALQFISNERTVRSNTVQDLKDVNSQSVATQAKKGEQLVSVMPAIRKALSLMSDHIVELSTENETLNNKLGSYDENWLEESTAKLLNQLDDEKRVNLIISRTQKQMKKNIKEMAYIGYDNLWKSDCDGMFSRKR